MSDTSSGRDPVEALAEEFLASRRRGEGPTVEQYAAEHPDLADAIRAVFPAMALVDDLGAGAATAVGPAVTPAVGAADRVGDFRIVREIGRGGMGVVYEAEQVSLGRRVALKLLPAGVRLDPKHRGRFEREARAAARLHHTNIVPVFGVGEHEGAPYYVMQFIEGRGLDAVIHELRRLADTAGGGTLPAPPPGTAPGSTLDSGAAAVAQSLLTGHFAEGVANADATTDQGVEGSPASIQHGAGLAPTLPAPATSRTPAPSASSLLGSSGGSGRAAYWRGVARVGAQVADALAYAHAQGVVHRDIKPSNLLLDPGGSVWVADFGLAKADDAPNLTESGDILGTLRYMPPEAFEGKAGAPGDVYSLGLTLYELIALRPAFDEPDRARLIRAVTEGSPPRLRRLNPEVPRDLETIVHKAIERDPSHRYASPSALAGDLRRFLDDRPIAARRVGELEKFWRWCRRNPLPAGLAAAFVAALALGAVASTYYALREARANADLRESVARERQRVALAMDAIKVFHGEVSGDLLLKEKEFGDLRGKLLRGAADFYARLEGSLSSQADPESRAALARAYDELGTLTATIGDKPEALAVARKALAVRRELAARPGAGPGAVMDLARALMLVSALSSETGDTAGALAAYEEVRRLAAGMPAGAEFDARRFQAAGLQGMGEVLAATGKPAEALANYEEARAIRERLAADRPDLVPLQAALAASHEGAGLVLSQTGHADRALRAFEQARAILERLAADHPEEAGFRISLSVSLARIGSEQDRVGKTALALESHQKAAAICERLAAENPAVTAIQERLAESHVNLGSFLERKGRPAEAMEAYQKDRATRARLATDHPGVPGYQHRLAASHNRISFLLEATGRTEAAVAASDDARAILERLAADHPDVTDYANELAATYYALGLLLERTNQAGRALAAMEQSTAIRERLASAHPDVTRFREDLATTYRDLSVFLDHRGEVDRGIEANRKAVAILDRLAADQPEVVGYRNRLGGAYSDLGLQLTRSNKPAQALEPFARARALLERLAAEQPDVHEFRNLLGAIEGNCAHALTRAGRPDEALKCLAKAKAIYERLAADAPDMPMYRRFQAMSCRMAAEALAGMGRLDEAPGEIDRAVAILDRLAGEQPGVADYRFDLAEDLLTSGRVRDMAGRFAPALEALAKSQALLERLVSDNPGLFEYQEKLGWVLESQGRALEHQGRAAEAIAAYQGASAIRERLAAAHPNNSQIQMQRVTIQARIATLTATTGDVAGGIAMLRHVLSVQEGLPPGPGEIYNVACTRSILAGLASRPGSGMTPAQAEAEAVAAMASLRRATDAGFRNLHHIRGDDDLMALRPRRDFQLLLLDLALPADPFAR